MSPHPRILLVEDEPSIAEPFAQALSREGFAPEVVRSAHEALTRARADPPDLVVLDLGLPDGDGRDVARELRRSSEVPIVILTARSSEIDRVVGLELGADDYVVKPFSAPEVIARIRAVLRRTRSGVARNEEGLMRFGQLEIDRGARRAMMGVRELVLSRKEFDLLTRLAQHAGRVVTRETLIAEVWDENWFGSTKTLDVHIRSLRSKLGDDGAHPSWIHTVRGVGYRFAAVKEE